MKTRITKKRLQVLNTAISLDDVLYERFRRLHADLDRHAAKLRRSQQVEVLAKRDGMLFNLQILEVRHSSDGMQVIVNGAR